MVTCGAVGSAEIDFLAGDLWAVASHAGIFQTTLSDGSKHYFQYHVSCDSEKKNLKTIIVIPSSLFASHWIQLVQ